jgi:hypothetical protein
MNEAALREEYERLLQRRADQPAPDVTADDMLALVAGTGPEHQRLRILATVMSHPALRHDFELLRSVAAADPAAAVNAAPSAPDGAGFEVSARSPRRYRWLRAAVVLLVASSAAVWLRRDAAEPPLRDAGAAGVVLAAPAAGARVTGEVRLVWHSVEGATGYTVELIDARGETLALRTTADTALVLPAADVRPGELRWIVTARLASGALTTSPMRPLHVSH